MPRSPSVESEVSMRDRAKHKRGKSRRYRRDSRSRSRSRHHSVSRSRSGSRDKSKSCYRSRSRRTRSRSHEDTVIQALAAITKRLDAIEGSTASSSHTPPRSVRNADPHCSSDVPSAAEALADALDIVINKVKPHNYYVSNFDPAVHNFETWCDEVERAKLTNKWGDLECLSRVAHCLKGDARTWLNEWVTNDRSWSNFIKEFRSLCPRKLDYANILFEVMNTNSDKFNTYAEYARRSLLRLRIVKGLSDELMVQIVIRGINDAQVRAAAANAELTVDNLVTFLAIYVKPGRGKPDNRLAPKPIMSSKRKHVPSSSNNNLCYSCGETGHIRINCHKKSAPSEKSKTVQCSYCKKMGHIESDCYAKRRAASSNNGQRKVNLCKEVHNSPRSRDITTAVIQGIPVDILIDSGALDVSLISSDIVKHFSCSRKPTHRILKGIGSNGIVAYEYVTLTVEFSKISLEVDFVVVPASFMNTPIIIGTDVLNRDGVTYVRTKYEQFLAHTPNFICTVEPVEFPNINTPLQGEELCSLMNVINDFKQFFITGTATTTVTTGKMQINLTSDVPVAYHPYRLSYQEKLKVREIIKDLLHKKIIRESKSEYASPIILVKKKDGKDRMCVDFRALNRITVKDRYPLPLIEDHIDRLGCSKFFTGLDMASGFHQILIDESTEELNDDDDENAGAPCMVSAPTDTDASPATEDFNENAAENVPEDGARSGEAVLG